MRVTSLLAFCWTLSPLGCQSCKSEGTQAPPQLSAVASGRAIPSASAPTADSSGLPPHPPSKCVPLPEVVAPLGPYKQWAKRFDVSPAPAKQRLPKLGILADLPEVPRSRLAYVRSGDILITEVPGGREISIQGGGSDFMPTWSPAGTYLAFLREVRGEHRVYVVRQDGSAPQRVSSVVASYAENPVAFSADERWLAFAAYDQGVVVHDLQTGAERRLPTPERVKNGPVFDPGGSRLAYMVYDQVFVVDAATGQERRYEPIDFKEVQSMAFTPGVIFIAASPEVGEPYRQTSVRSLDLNSGKSGFAFVPGFTAGAWVTLFAAPKSSRLALAINSRPTVEEKDSKGNVSFGVGGWIQRSLFVHEPNQPGNHGDRSLDESFPQPLFSTSSPAWAPDGRHLAFEASLWKKLQDDSPEVEAIVAVDTEHLQGDPVYVTCGHDPAWGPLLPTKNP